MLAARVAQRACVSHITAGLRRCDGAANHIRACTVAARLSHQVSNPDTRCASALPPPVRIYRLSHIRLLRAVLRVKIVQLTAGVGVLFPAAAVYFSGGSLTFAEGATVAAVMGGTMIAGSTLSWYCERIVGELSWLPAERALRVSTLTMWGERCDLDLPHQVLLAQGFAPTPAREYD